MSEAKKILFIIPPYFNIDDHTQQSMSTSFPAFTSPYGVLSIDAYIKANVRLKVEAQLLDLNIHARNVLDGDRS